MKALGLVHHAGGRACAAHGLAYTAGVLVSFAARGGRAARPPRGRRADRLGLSAPVAGLRHAARLRAVRDGARPVGRDRPRRPLDGRGPVARRSRRLRGIVLHRRARHRRGDAVHGAVHGDGHRLGASPSRGSTALLVFEALGLGLALPYLALDPGAGVAPRAPRARPVDGAARAAPGVPALRHGRVAGVGREPAGRTGRRRRRARRPGR